MRMYSRIYVVALVFVLSSASFAQAQWMSLVPRSAAGGYPQAFLEACSNINQWPTVRNVTTYLGSFTADLHQADDPTLAACFTSMRNAGLRLSIEAAAIQPPPTPGCGLAPGCFNDLSPLLSRIIALGAPAIQIRLQEPLSTARFYAGWTLPQVVSETVGYLQLLHANFPGVEVTLVEAYPYNSAALLRLLITSLHNACINAGVPPPRYFELDHDINAAGWSWSEIPTIRDEARARGWDFAYIFGSPRVPGSTWHSTALVQGNGNQTFGINPDRYVFESWESNDPLVTVPESQTCCPPSFMGTVKFFMDNGHFVTSAAALRANNGQWVGAAGGGGGLMVATAFGIGPWERLRLVDQGGGYFALRCSNGQYVVAEDGGGRELLCNRNAPGAWERFLVIDLGSGNFALQCNSGQYVVAEGGGGQELACNRNTIGAWETFAAAFIP